MQPSPRLALIWSFAERYASLVVAIGSTMILSRLLTPTDVGIYSMCAAVAAVAGILRDFGVSEYLIQERDLTREKIRAAYGIAFIVAWSIGALVFLSRYRVAAFYGEPAVAQVLAVLSLHFIILPIASPTFALMNRELAFRQIFGLQVVCNTMQAVVSVVLAYRGHAFMSLAWGPIAAVALQSVLLMWMRPRDSLVLPGLQQVRTVLRFGSMFVTSRVVEVLSRNFHEPVVAKQFDFAAVGLFSRAYGLVELFHTNVGAAVIRVATPAFAAKHRAGQPLAEAFARATAIFVSVSWAFFGFIALTSHQIIDVMFGSQWLAAAPIASILAVSWMPHGLCALAPQMLSATGHVKRRLRITLLCSPIQIIGVLVAAQFSLHAVAAVWLVTNLATVVLYVLQLRTTLGTSARELYKPCLGSAWVTLASVAAQAATLLALREHGVPALLQLVVVFAVGVLAWACVGRVLAHPAYHEAAQLLAAARRRVPRRR